MVLYKNVDWDFIWLCDFRKKNKEVNKNEREVKKKKAQKNKKKY